MNHTQSERSKMWMTEALYKLMKTKPYVSITIKEITEKAGVSRLTFYRNFSSKDDILERHFQTLFQQFMEHIESNCIDSLQSIIELMYGLWQKNEEHIHLLLQNNLGNILYAPFSQNLEVLLKHLQMSEKINDNQIAFISGGLYASMIKWINSENTNPKEIATSVMDILKIPG